MADLVTGGKRLCGELACGYYLEPIVFSNVSNTMAIAREEFFGPVVSVIPFDTVDEVVLANDTEYGLASGVWTSNIDYHVEDGQWHSSRDDLGESLGLVDPALGLAATRKLLREEGGKLSSMATCTRRRSNQQRSGPNKSDHVC